MFSLFVVQAYIFQWIRNPEGKLIKVSILQEPNSELNISLRPMEHLEEEQHGQYPVERNPNTCRSMRDYRNPPWMSAPSYMVPQRSAPYENAYNPSWGNHTNSSWESGPPQYTPHDPPYCASTPQPPQRPRLSSSVEEVILKLSKLVDTFIEERKAVNVQVNQKIDTVKSSIDKRIDEFQSKIDQKFDIL